jgi:hypothetical protein
VTKRNLIIIHRGPEYERDFDEIAAKVNALDRDITVYHLPAALKVELPVSAWQYPTLTVSLSSKFRIPIRRGPILKNYAIEKMAQQEMFRKHNIPTPPALPFRLGMKLDPILFGEFVVIKTIDLRKTSQGTLAYLFRRRRVEEMNLDSFPQGHPIRTAPSSFIIQKFINTGEHPNYFRVSTFMGHVLYVWHTSIHEKRAPLNASDDAIERSIVDIKGGTMLRTLTLDNEVIRLAKETADAFSDIPLLGIDIVRDDKTRKLAVLEINAGGNTWHFSSPYGKSLRTEFGIQCGVDNSLAEERGRQHLTEQFNAFDLAAEVLAKKTAELAA